MSRLNMAPQEDVNPICRNFVVFHGLIDIRPRADTQIRKLTT
jgi:hypothetical protein